MNSGYFCLHIYLPPDLKFDSVNYPRNMQDTRVEAAHSRCDLAAQPLAESGALIGARQAPGRLETDSCWSDGFLLPGQLELGYSRVNLLGTYKLMGLSSLSLLPIWPSPQKICV